MRFEDIHLSDQTLYSQVKQMFASRQYIQMLQALSQEQLTNKVLDAAGINYITGELVRIQNLNDPDFDKDLIQVSEDEPADISSGNVWFEINN